MKKRWIYILLTIVSLTGCSEEKKVDYAIEGIEETEENKQPESENRETGKTGLAQFEGEENWKETLSVNYDEIEWDGENVIIKTEVSINAPITVPQVNQMSVVEVEEAEFNAEWKAKVAENLFDDGQIYYGDVTHLPKKELKEIQNRLAREDRIMIASGDYLFSGDEGLQRFEGLQEALENVENATDIYTPVEEYSVDEYLGIYEGQRYYLNFIEIKGSRWNYYRQRKQIVWMVADFDEVCPEKFKNQMNQVCSPWMKGNWVENQCEISEEEALEQAREFAKQLGLDYPVYSYSRPLLWGTPPEYVNEDSATDGWEVNGYVFYFDLGTDELSFVGYGAEEDYGRLFNHTDNADKKAQYSLESRLQIYVTAQGVIRMIANNPVEIVGVSESVELLPLDTIKSMMKKAMDEEWKTLSLREDNITTFDSMELIYFRVSDKENPGKYSYVPAWRLGNVTRDQVLHQISIKIPVVINAIDGSFINFGEEM